MNQNDLRLAVIAVNNTLATNNPKGVTDALRNFGYPVDGQFDILSYDALNKALLDIYDTDRQKWGQIVKSVKFNYEKTDSSTTQNTKTFFENIIRSIDPNYVSSSTTGKFQIPSWMQTAIGLIVGQTTTTHVIPGDVQFQSKASAWVYVAYAILGLAIVGIVYITFKQKNV